MADTEVPQDTAPGKKSKLSILIGVLLFALGGGGGFYAIHSGLLGMPNLGHRAAASPTGLPDITFVPVKTLVITIGDGATARHLKFTSSLEVTHETKAQVTSLLPRILDVMNGYLHAVDPADLEAAPALVRLKAQLLRRIQLVVGGSRVRDLLVTEFVLD